MRKVNMENKFQWALLVFVLLLPLMMLLTGAYLSDYPTHKKFADTLVGCGSAGLVLEGVIAGLFLFG
jgi:hypothetical protein